MTSTPRVEELQSEELRNARLPGLSARLRAHAYPLALTAIGLGWLAAKQWDFTRHRANSDTVHRTTYAAWSSAQGGYIRTGRIVQTKFNEHPIAAGAPLPLAHGSQNALRWHDLRILHGYGR